MTRTTAALNSVIKRIFMGSDVVKAASLAFKVCVCVCEGEGERENKSESKGERERARTPTHLHSVSTIQYLSEMASSFF